MPKIIARIRFEYHCFLLDLNNVLNQLHLRSDERAEEIGKKHFMILLFDIFPRLGCNTDLFFKEMASKKH